MDAQATIKPDYEDFEPYCKWKKEQESDTLDLHLQGFKKEQMKIQLSQVGVIHISGERPLDETKTRWSRFKKEIKLSNDYRNDDIHAKLSGGVLSIIMPKKPTVTAIIVQEQPRPPPENQENERNAPKTTVDKELSNGNSVMSSENSKLPSYGGFQLLDLISNKKMAVNVAVPVALAVTLGALAIYKYPQHLI